MTNKNFIPFNIINQPIAIASGYIDTYISSLNPETIQAISEKAFLDGFSSGTSNIQKIGQIAVIQVYGALQHRSDIYSWFFGSSTYEGIRADYRAALNDSGVKAILFDIESPGGMVAGVFDLSDEIYASRSIKPTYAFVNEYAFSGAYALASSASKIYLPRTGQVGSIGVIAVHVDQSGYDAKFGVKYTPIYAGDRKNDFSPHSELSQEAYGAAKANIDKTYDLFTSSVAKYRGVPQESVISTQAGIFSSTDAISNGLADGILSFEQVIESINNDISNSSLTTNAKKKDKKGNRMEPENIKTQLAAMFAESADVTIAELKALGYEPVSTEAKPDIEAIKIEATQAGSTAETSRVNEIMELCELAGLNNLASIKPLLSEGVTAEDARGKIIEAKAAMNDNNNIDSAHGGMQNGGVNPLLANAKKRAGRE